MNLTCPKCGNEDPYSGSIATFENLGTAWCVICDEVFNLPDEAEVGFIEPPTTEEKTMLIPGMDEHITEMALRAHSLHGFIIAIDNRIDMRKVVSSAIAVIEESKPGMSKHQLIHANIASEMLTEVEDVMYDENAKDPEWSEAIVKARALAIMISAIRPMRMGEQLALRGIPGPWMDDE